MKLTNKIAAAMAAGLMLAAGTVTAFAAESTYICPRGNEACTEYGACIEGTCEQYNCPRGNEACNENGACFSSCGVRARKGGCCR